MSYGFSLNPCGCRPRKQGKPLFKCSAEGCRHRTTKNQARANGGVCHFCKSPLRAQSLFVVPVDNNRAVGTLATSADSSAGPCATITTSANGIGNRGTDSEIAG